MLWKTFIQIVLLVALLGAIILLILMKVNPIDRYDFKESTFDVYAGERSFSRKAIIKMDKATGKSWELDQASGLTGRFKSRWESIEDFPEQE